LVPLGLAVAFGLSTLGFARGFAPGQADKVRWTHRVTGRVVGFEAGDYLHARVKDARGKETSYFVGNRPEVGYFLAAHARQPLTLTVQRVETTIAEAGGRMEIDRIQDARLNRLDAKTWWAQLRRKSSHESLVAKYERAIERLSGRPMRLAPVADPVVIAVDGWVLGVKAGSSWKAAGPSLGGKRLRFASPTPGKARTALVEYDAGPPAPTLTLKGMPMIDQGTLLVSGGKAKFAALRRIGKNNPAYLAAARSYAASKGKGKLPVRIEDGMQVDLNRDGKLDVVLAVTSGSTLANRKKADYAAILIRTLVGGKVKTIEFAYETNFGEMRGPFRSRVVGAGDFDGDGTTEFVVTSHDPWGNQVWLLQLTKDGRIRELFTVAESE
jgi:hypothetical protein